VIAAVVLTSWGPAFESRPGPITPSASTERRITPGGGRKAGGAGPRRSSGRLGRGRVGAFRRSRFRGEPRRMGNAGVDCARYKGSYRVPETFPARGGSKRRSVRCADRRAVFAGHSGPIPEPFWHCLCTI